MTQNKNYTIMEMLYNGRLYLIAMALINLGVLLTNNFIFGFILLNIYMFAMFLLIESKRDFK